MSMLMAARGAVPGEFDVEHVAPGGSRHSVPLADAAKVRLAGMVPARRVKARKGQQNLSGGGGRRPHWRHDLVDQANQRPSVLHGVLPGGARVEQTLPRGPLPVSGFLRHLRDLGAAYRIGSRMFCPYALCRYLVWLSGGKSG